MKATGNRREKKALPLVCFAVTTAILLAGLWPFNFRPRNEVTWVDGQNGIHFGQRGIAYSTESVYGPRQAIRPGGAISIELVVRTARELDDSIARILTLYGGGNRQFFTLAQWKSHLVLRAASQGNDLHRDFRETEVENVLPKNITKFFTVTSQNGNTAIYADGQMMRLIRNFPILPTDSSASGIFVLGNSPGGSKPWTGDLLFLAAYGRELSASEVLEHFRDWTKNGTPTWLPGESPALLYTFAERTGATSRNHSGPRNDLSIPATFDVLNKIVLRPPWEEDFSRSFNRDLVVNILGFLPFGFFFTAWLRIGDGFPSKSTIFFVAALGGTISLTIELLQTYLPTRSSQLSDVICNITGTILGAYLTRWALLVLGIEKNKGRQL